MKVYRWQFFCYAQDPVDNARPIGKPIIIEAESNLQAEKSWETTDMSIIAESDFAMLINERFEGICTKYRGKDYG